MRVEQFLRHSALRFPDKTALVASGRRLSFREIDTLSDQLAQGLTDRGIARGDRVVLSGQQCRAVVSIFAI
jgi:non-ribosomal peptide synthetase component E (peptide arylation enzyme)